MLYYSTHAKYPKIGGKGQSFMYIAFKILFSRAAMYRQHAVPPTSAMCDGNMY